LSAAWPAPGRAAYTVNAKANTGLIAIHALIERLWQQRSRERSVAGHDGIYHGTRA